MRPNCKHGCTQVVICTGQAAGIFNHARLTPTTVRTSVPMPRSVKGVADTGAIGVLLSQNHTTACTGSSGAQALHSMA